MTAGQAENTIVEALALFLADDDIPPWVRESFDVLLVALRSSREHAETYEQALERILDVYHARDPEDMPQLPFRMKEIALKALAAVSSADPAGTP